MLRLLLCSLGLTALLGTGLLAARKFLTWGPQKIVSRHFFDHVYNSDPGFLLREIRRDADTHDHGKDPLTKALLAQRSAEDKVLILSGGGQWGAYGAGLFAALSAQSGNDLALSGVKIITGISTGSLQTLLLMVALDEAATPELRREAIARLTAGYSPTAESQVVKNSGMLMLPLRGAQAGTDPLRARIRQALGNPAFLDAIANSSIDGYIGFVEANCGDFHYADVKGLITGAATTDDAIEALTAAAMASSAMPVFHQQLRVQGPSFTRTLYDGGVRKSVFFEAAIERMSAQPGPNPTFYVVRNGPTTRAPAPELDATDSPLANGQRAYDLLVNEAELGSIASLRLSNPYGDIFVTTADQWDDFPGRDPAATKGTAMFNPSHMTELRKLGAYKATREGGPWWPLSRLK